MLRYGFFNSENGDRTYDANDMGRLFDGIIRDGVFLYSGEHLEANDGNPWPLQVMSMNDPNVRAVQVAPGRAWFNGTWTDLSRDEAGQPALYLPINENTTGSTRYDYVVLIIDKRSVSSGRNNSIRVLQNSPEYGSGSSDIHTYVLAKITVGDRVSYISDQNIELFVGRDVCTVDGVDYPAAPFVTAPLEKVGIEPLFAYWYGQTNQLIDAAIDAYFEGLTVTTKPEDIGGGIGVCSTAAATTTKTATIQDYKLTPAGRFSIRFVNDVPSSATLNISDGTNYTGAKPIWRKNTPIGADVIKANNLVTFVYDPTTATTYPNGRYLVAAIDSAEEGGLAYDNIVYADIINLQANITPGIIYTELVTNQKNILYCLFDHYTRIIYTLHKKPVDSSVAYFVGFDSTNNAISLCTMDSNGGISYTSIPVGGSTPTWNDIKPSGGIPTSDLADDTNSKWGMGFGTCTTGQATSAKTVSITGYKLVKDGFVAIRFTNAVNGGATLSINSQTAKAIYHAGSALQNGVIRAGDTCIFAYDGSYYQLVAIVPSGAVVLELTKSGSNVYLDMTFANAYAAFTSPWSTYLLLQIDTGVPLLMRPSKVDSVNSTISVEAIVGTTLYTATLSPVTGQAQMSGTLTQTTVNEDFSVTFTYSAGSYSCDKTPAQIAAALTAGTPIALQIDGNYSGFLKSADQYSAVFYMYDMDDHWPVFRQYYLSSDGTVTTYEFEPAQNTTIQNVSGSTPTINPNANKIYECGELSSLTIGSTAVYDDFTIRFTSGSTATTFSAPSWMIMPDGFSVEANTRYEINVSDGYAVVASWAVSSS